MCAPFKHVNGERGQRKLLQSLRIFQNKLMFSQVESVPGDEAAAEEEAVLMSDAEAPSHRLHSRRARCTPPRLDAFLMFVIYSCIYYSCFLLLHSWCGALPTSLHMYGDNNGRFWSVLRLRRARSGNAGPSCAALTGADNGPT